MMGRLGQPPGESYFDALATFHERGDNLKGAWETREHELRTTHGKGQLAYESQVRIKRIRLLARMGQSFEEEERSAKAAIARLRDPSWYLTLLDRARCGEEEEL